MTANEMNKNDTSGYTDDIAVEMGKAAPLPTENAFSDMEQRYVSATGHTRLLTATR